MTYGAPSCLSCSFYRKSPQCIGGKATCAKYPNGIPKNIYFEQGKCAYAPTPTTPKSKTAPKKTSTAKTAKRARSNG